MISALNAQTKINSFHVQGKIISEPSKQLSNNGKVFVFFKLETKFIKTKVDVPLIISGSRADSFATMFHKGDELSVNGMFMIFQDKLTLLVTQFELIKQGNGFEKLTDRFQKIVEMYSLDNIDKRFYKK